MSSVAVYYFQNGNEPWREAAGYIDKNSAENDSVFVIPSFAKYSFERYSRKESLRIIEDEEDIPLSASGVWVMARGNETKPLPEKHILVPEEKFGDLYLYRIK